MTTKAPLQKFTQSIEMGIHTDYRVEQRCRLGALSRLSQCSVEYSSLNDLISQLGGLLFAARQYTLRMPHTQFGIFLRFWLGFLFFRKIVYKFACSAFCLAKAVIFQQENSQLHSWISHRTEGTGALKNSPALWIRESDCGTMRMQTRLENRVFPTTMNGFGRHASRMLSERANYSENWQSY